MRFLFGGLVLQVIAGIILAISASKTVDCSYEESCITKPTEMSDAAIAWTWILGGLGGTLLAFALVGLAVMLGIRAARDTA